MEPRIDITFKFDKSFSSIKEDVIAESLKRIDEILKKYENDLSVRIHIEVVV